MYFITTKRMLELCFSAHPNIQYRTLFLNKIISELDVIRALVEARISQNLTQKELAARTGIDQADISKLENGTRNPSLNLLKRLAVGMGMVLRIEFVPKRK